MTERQDTECDRLYARFKEGAAARREGTSNPYQPHTVDYLLYVLGWVREDLRLALMKADPTYAADQARHEQAERS